MPLDVCIKLPQWIYTPFKVSLIGFVTRKELGTFGHKKHLVVQEVTKITGKNRNVRILDVAAGTGICGELVSPAIPPWFCQQGARSSGSI